MSILMRLVPAWLVLAVFALLAFVIMGLFAVNSNQRARTARAETALADYKGQQERAARIASEAARTEETRRESAKQEVIDHARQETAAAQAAARAADAAATGLRARLAAYTAAVRRATTDPQPASGSAPADPMAVFADVFGRLDDAAGRYAAAADSAHVAGTACQRAYDALIQPTQ